MLAKIDELPGWGYEQHFLHCLVPGIECTVCNAYHKTDHYRTKYQGKRIIPVTAVGNAFRKATSACPYSKENVTLIYFPGRNFASGKYAKTREEKRQVLLSFDPSRDGLLVAWPGATQDVFDITSNDERNKALAILGLRVRTPIQPRTYTAANGSIYEETR